MVILKTQSNPKKDLEKVSEFSRLVEKKLFKFNKNDETRIDKLSFEELQDFNQILKMADFLLCKYENKKQVHSLLKDFVEIINNSTTSVESLDDEFEELVLSAETNIKRIREIQNNVSETFTLDKKEERNKPEEISDSKIGSINLTKSSTPVYTQEYQEKSTLESEQVI